MVASTSRLPELAGSTFFRLCFHASWSRGRLQGNWPFELVRAAVVEPPESGKNVTGHTTRCPMPLADALKAPNRLVTGRKMSDACRVFGFGQIAKPYFSVKFGIREHPPRA